MDRTLRPLDGRRTMIGDTYFRYPFVSPLSILYVKGFYQERTKIESYYFYDYEVHFRAPYILMFNFYIFKRSVSPVPSRWKGMEVLPLR